MHAARGHGPGKRRPGLASGSRASGRAHARPWAGVLHAVEGCGSTRSQRGQIGARLPRVMCRTGILAGRAALAWRRHTHARGRSHEVIMSESGRTPPISPRRRTSPGLRSPRLVEALWSRPVPLRQARLSHPDYGIHRLAHTRWPETLESVKSVASVAAAIQRLSSQ
jgi:hypothetical protein